MGALVSAGLTPNAELGSGGGPGCFTVANIDDTITKAQTAAIYRKANVTGRPQLLSLFIEDLMGADRSNPADIESAA